MLGLEFVLLCFRAGVLLLWLAGCSTPLCFVRSFSKNVLVARHDLILVLASDAHL